MTDFADLKKLASLPTRVVPLCLAGELVEEHAALERQFADAPPATSLEKSPKRVIAEQIVAVEDRMREATVDFRLRAMSARKWATFWARWPVRTKDETDEAWDGRIFPYWTEMISRSAENPRMSVEQVDELAGLVHSRAWSELVGACLGLNQGSVDVPNFEAASDLIGTSEQT